MQRRTHFAAEKLSLAGLTIVHRGRRENWTIAKIQAELQAATRERVARSSLSRYLAKCAIEQRSLEATQEQANAIAAQMQAGDITAVGMGKALLTQALSDVKEALKRSDPIAATYALTALDRVELKRMEIELRRREIEFNERKFEAMQEKDAKVKAAAEGLKEVIDKQPGEWTPADRERVLEVYGLATQ